MIALIRSREKKRGLLTETSISQSTGAIFFLQAGQCGNQIGAKFWEVSLIDYTGD